MTSRSNPSCRITASRYLRVPAGTSPNNPQAMMGQALKAPRSSSSNRRRGGGKGGERNDDDAAARANGENGDKSPVAAAAAEEVATSAPVQAPMEGQQEVQASAES